MLPRKFCLKLALFIIATTRRNLALLYLRTTVIILQADSLNLIRITFSSEPEDLKAKEAPILPIYFIYSDFTTNLSFMAQS